MKKKKTFDQYRKESYANLPPEQRKRVDENLAQMDRMLDYPDDYRSPKGQESSLSRLLTTHAKEHDIAVLTAWRLPEFTPQENKERNRSLNAMLLRLKYGVTRVDGAWKVDQGTEDERLASEDSFFVVNLPDNDDFEQQIIGLGKHYYQDAVMVKRQGEPAYLIGTSARENAWSGYGKRIKHSGIKIGDEDQEYQTRVRNRPFTFTERNTFPSYRCEDLDHFYKHNHLGKQAIACHADKVIRKVFT